MGCPETVETDMMPPRCVVFAGRVRRTSRPGRTQVRLLTAKVTTARRVERLARRCTAKAATAPASLIARCASTGASTLPDRPASQPNSHPATPVTSTVPTTGSPAPRASTMWDNPNAAACSRRPGPGPNASAAAVPRAARYIVSSDHTVPSGISTVSHFHPGVGTSRARIAGPDGRDRGGGRNADGHRGRADHAEFEAGPRRSAAQAQRGAGQRRQRGAQRGLHQRVAPARDRQARGRAVAHQRGGQRHRGDLVSAWIHARK